MGPQLFKSLFLLGLVAALALGHGGTLAARSGGRIGGWFHEHPAC